MSANHISPIKIKILGDGDEVLNLWPTDSGYQVAIKNRKGEVFVTSISLDENNIPRISRPNPAFIITYAGETGPEIEAEKNQLKVTSF